MLSILTSLEFFCVVKSPFAKQALVFTCLQYKSFENIVGKGEIARNKQFLLFPQCFLPVWRTSAIFIKFEIVVCKLSIWKSKIWRLGKG